MGCFDINGGISKIPIVYQDECFLMIGVIHKEYKSGYIDEFGNGFFFTPICLPIYGTYNDYGVIENIVRDKNIEYIESKFGYTIEDIIESIDNKLAGRYDEEDKYNNICNDILYKLNLDKDKYELGVSIEHRFIYDSIYKLNINIDSYINFKESLKFSNSFPYTIDEVNKDNNLTKKYGYVNSFYIDMVLNKYKCDNIREELWDNIMNINPNYRVGFYRLNTYFDSRLFMCVYKGDDVRLLLNELGEEYIKFLVFFEKMGLLNWNTSLHNYSGQDGYENIIILKSYFEDIIKYIDKKAEEYNKI